MTTKYTPSHWETDWKAKAKLISAAPELLEALYAVLPYIETAESDDAYKAGAVAKITKQIRDAIAQATL